MLATFVIGLREGLEAALIVGIIAAFLKQQGRADRLRQMWLGIGLAVLICVAIGVGLAVLSYELDQTAQEAMETVIALVAVAMITYMVIWMRRHSRDLRQQLHDAAGSALATGSALALVAMAFLAVLREGIETVAFLLAQFRVASTPALAGVGAGLGIVIAAGLGYGIYRGGVKLNLSRFFRITGVVLVLVAAGLLMSAMRTGHSAGWINVGQAELFNLSWLVQPGSIIESLLTGVLGLQRGPRVIEVIVWVIYFVPLAAYVVWPQPKRREATQPATVAG